MNAAGYEDEENDDTLTRRIFNLQDEGRFYEAQRLTGQLSDQTILGHILARRYLHPSYRASFEELRSWMQSYADLPEAARIERLAITRRTDAAAPLPAASYNAPSIEEIETRRMRGKHHQPAVIRTAAQAEAVRVLIEDLRRLVQVYEPSRALRLFNESPAQAYLDAVEKDRARAIIASGYLYAGNLDRALSLATPAMKSSGAAAPMAAWVRGLVLWQKQDFAGAARAFDLAARSDYASGNMASAASFWAARAHEAVGNKRKAHRAMILASQYPRTFYGLLASTRLGRRIAPDWTPPVLSHKAELLILSTPAGQRAEALLAAGEVTLAEQEIRALYKTGDKDRKTALLAYAHARGLPRLSLQLGHALCAEESMASYAALYPEMPWMPNRGYKVDPALIHAITRQESRFDPAAQSGSGALGLMQVMPETAGHVIGDADFAGSADVRLLSDPQVSLNIGQEYVAELLNSQAIGQDLLSMAMAYNAGPGRLAKWKAERPAIKDPLLFVETIPFAETRSFAQNVLANYWIYESRFDDAPSTSLTAMAKGNWARYADKGHGGRLALR